MSFDAKAICFGFLLPMSVCALSIFAAATLLKQKRTEAAVAAGGAVSLAIGFFAGFVLLDFHYTFPLTESWQWLVYLLLLAAVAVSVESLFALPVAVKRLVRLLTAALSGWLLIPEYASIADYRHWWQIGLGAVIWILWCALNPVMVRWRRPAVAVLLTTISVTSTAFLGIHLAAKLGQVSGLVTAALFGATLMAFFFPKLPCSQGMVPGFSIVLPGLLTAGWLNNFAELPLTYFAAMVAAPLILAAAYVLPPLAESKRWKTIAAAAATLAILLPAIFSIIQSLMTPEEW